MSKIELTSDFMAAIDLMNCHTGQPIFITGKAGTGKSTLLSYFCAHALYMPVVLSVTGVSALHVKGQTIHSFFNFYIDITYEKIRNHEVVPKNIELYKSVHTIIIDEASMLRADLLDCIDIFLRMYGKDPDKPFGGVRMIFIGDLYQLPPVVMFHEQEHFFARYNTPYFFSAHVMSLLSMEVMELKYVYRQSDQEFISLLNKVRDASLTDDDIAVINQSCNAAIYEEGNSKDDMLAVTLTTTNKKANDINKVCLNSLVGVPYSSIATIAGDFGEDNNPTAYELHYKIGAQIMMLNNDQRRRWVNGSVGVVHDVRVDKDDREFICVLLHNDKKIVRVYPFTWEVYKYALDGENIVSTSVGSFTQYPFRLAWAITIHKSQGKTFERVIIDTGKGAFANGQIYVALSRCTSMQGISLRVPIKRQDIRADSRVRRFLRQHNI